MKAGYEARARARKEKERERADSKMSYSSSEGRRSHEKHDKKGKSSLDQKNEKRLAKGAVHIQSGTSKHSEVKAISTKRESYKKHQKRPSGLARFLSCGC